MMEELSEFLATSLHSQPIDWNAVSKIETIVRNLSNLVGVLNDRDDCSEREKTLKSFVDARLWRSADALSLLRTEMIWPRAEDGLRDQEEAQEGQQADAAAGAVLMREVEDVFHRYGVDRLTVGMLRGALPSDGDCVEHLEARMLGQGFVQREMACLGEPRRLLLLRDLPSRDRTSTEEPNRLLRALSRRGKDRPEIPVVETIDLLRPMEETAIGAQDAIDVLMLYAISVVARDGDSWVKPTAIRSALARASKLDRDSGDAEVGAEDTAE